MSKYFCSLPWIHLATHPHGGATICCQSEMENGISAASNADGNDPITLNERPIENLVNSKTFKEIRLAMLKGEKHPACGPCWEREALGVVSKRIYDNKRFPMSVEEARSKTAPDGTITPDIQFAELRLGNTCNVKCVTCNPNSSNSHSMEYETLRNQPGMDFLRDYSWVKPGMSDWTKNESFWDDLGNETTNLKEVYINGGEPMLIKQHVGFLERLIRDGRAKNVRITYSINMTRLIEQLRPLWKEFAEVHFSCSIDDWNERNFYIRYPSSWASVTENFAKLLDWGFHPHVLQTISVLNFYNLDDFYTNWQKLHPNSVIVYNDVFDPPWFSPLVLPPELRSEIIAKLRKTLPSNLISQVEKMYGGNEYTPELWPVLKKHLAAYDSARDTNVCEYFPEFEKFLNDHQLSFR